jgi:hypothetical protein
MLYPLSYGGSVVSPAVFSLNRWRACHRVEGFVALKPRQHPSIASVGPLAVHFSVGIPLQLWQQCHFDDVVSSPTPVRECPECVGGST